MNINVGSKDRLMRIIVGLAILIPHYVYYLVTGYYCPWANIGYIPLLTGLFKFSPKYPIFNLNTVNDGG
jgi:Inner membrane protein YgaP-like, transmembrane domain